MNPSNKLKLHLSTISQQINNRPRENSKTSSRAPSIKVPEKLQNYEFDDGDSGNLPLSYRDDYENMMNNYYNTSPKSNPYKTSSKPSSKFNSPIASPEIYSKSYNSNNEIGSPRSDRRSKRINNKKRYSDDESNEDEYSYRNSRRAPSRKSKYEEEEEDIFMYENDVDDYRSRKSSPTNSHNRKAFNEDDFDEDESDITFSESSDSFSSSEDDSSEASESETDDDNLPLRNTKAKPSGIRGRNRHYKKFNKLETSSYKEEKSPIKSSKSTSRKSLTPKMEKKKKTLSIPTQKYSQPSPGIKSPKENIYEDTAKENFLARSKKDFTSDFAEASVKKVRII
ncbi:hypothetical protein BCR36DRAFT_289676 [Piromyces finnis]|uniref:Uncharacterized protein n=1 Tax=Piromyces finnis TaxID=1754191 RepID=A0A1Y1V9S8_9FUNG|nr:hypothetical protein BCR36DRAFT_289676 [Piromyces finnis]|eukprot:ORX50729.1 hypothetical protein BCR36DRAFT_289676 [Piromyces finnis]